MKNQIIKLPTCGYYTIEKGKLLQCTEFMITFGGGMGGGNKRIYGHIFEENDKRIIIEQLNGEFITLYTNFIVYEKKVSVYLFENYIIVFKKLDIANVKFVDDGVNRNITELLKMSNPKYNTDMIERIEKLF